MNNLSYIETAKLACLQDVIKLSQDIPTFSNFSLDESLDTAKYVIAPPNRVERISRFFNVVKNLFRKNNLPTNTMEKTSNIFKHFTLGPSVISKLEAASRGAANITFTPEELSIIFKYAPSRAAEGFNAVTIAAQEAKTYAAEVRKALLQEHLLSALGGLASAASVPMAYYAGKRSATNPIEQAKEAALKKLAGAVGEPILRPTETEREEYPFVGAVWFQGLKIDIENERGTYREGVGKNGKKWRTYMNYHYGEIRNSEGADGDKVDVYVGPNHDSRKVFVVHQNHPDSGEYDEDKVMLGFDSAEDAKEAYYSQYTTPDKFFRSLTEMPLSQFKAILESSKEKGKKIASKLALAKQSLVTPPKGDQVAPSSAPVEYTTLTTPDADLLGARITRLASSLEKIRADLERGEDTEAPKNLPILLSPNLFGKKLSREPHAEKGIA